MNNNTHLTELICYKNQLSELDVNHNTELTYLDCTDNAIKSLDLSNNNKLNDYNLKYDETVNVIGKELNSTN